jgi:hypothetical protein
MVETTHQGQEITESEDRQMGGEAFGNIVMFTVILGALVLVGIIVFAVLALNGQFLHPYLDPPV